MLTLTSVEAQNRFGQLLDAAQREPITITRRGRPIAMLIAAQDYAALLGERGATQAAAQAGRTAIDAFRGAGTGGTVAQLLADRRADLQRELRRTAA
jgi:prevent-host-death family protein